MSSASAAAGDSQANAIPSDGTWLAPKTVNGTVFFDRAGRRSDMQQGDEPMAGVKVYAQWIDYRANGGTVSPIYTATSQDNGRYTISLPDWTDAHGTVHKWEATVGQYLRVWVENPDSTKYSLGFAEGDSKFGQQGDRYLGTWNGTVGINLAETWNFGFQEKPQDWLFKPEPDRVQSPAPNGGGYVAGRLFYNQRGTYGNTVAPLVYEPGYGDKAIANNQVVASYVQDEVARRFDQWKNANAGFTRDEFRTAQKDIMAAYEAETGNSAIAETVYTTTDADGKYHVQFQGLWGNGYNAKGAIFDEAKYGKWGTLAPAGESGTVFDANNKGTFTKSGANSKHVNVEYMYVAPVLPDGLGASMDNMRDAMFQYGANDALYATTSGVSNINDQDFGVLLENQAFDVLKYNTSDAPAAPGDTVETSATGLIPDAPYVVVWRDSKGNEITRCTDAVTSNVGELSSCPMTVPADLPANEIYTATLYAAADTGTPLLADSFVAQIKPAYKPTEVQAGSEATVAVPLNNNGKAVPSGVVFSAGPDAPAWATVNPDGSIALKPGVDVPAGDVSIPVIATYPDGRTVELTAPVTVAPAPQAATNDPAYTPTSIAAGGSATVGIPSNSDGSALPDGTTFAPGTDVPAWATVNPDGSISLKPGADVPTGDVTIPVVVTYPDGSTETINATVTITDNQAALNDPAYKPTSVAAGGEATVATPVNSDGSALPDGTTFAPGTDVPAWATVNPDGTITLKPGADVPTGDVTIPVVVTYPDGSTETIDVTVTVTDNQAAANDPAYDAGTGIPGADVKLPQTGDTDMPSGTTYETTSPNVAVDPNTGEVTVSIPADAKPGDKITGTITVTYPDGSTEDVTVTVTVTENQAGANDPAYKPTSVAAGGEATVATPVNSDGSALPDGTTFAPGTDVPAWATVNPDGTITLKPGADVPTGDVIIPVVVTYPDGSTETINVTVTVTDNQAAANDPAYDAGTGIPGADVKLPQTGDTDMPSGTTYETTSPNVAVDPNTGEVTVSVPADAKPGDKITGTITVTYPDGSTEDVTVTVTVGEPAPTDADANDPAYDAGTGKPGTDVTLPQTGDTDMPSGTTYETTSPNVAVDPNTGEVTVSVPADAKPGDKITGTITVTYPDGSTEDVTVTVTVGTPDTPTPAEDPAWTDTTVPGGGSVTLPNSGGPVTDGTTVEVDGPGTADLGKDGTITVTPTDKAKPGDKITVTVKDGNGDTVDTITITVEVPAATPDADVHNPAYQDGTALPGRSVTLPQTGDTAMPDGTKYATTSDNVTVDANTGEVTVSIPADAKPGDKITGTITVTYPDGSTEDVTVTVTVGTPDTPTPAENPNWEDTNVPSNGSVDLPNTGGPVTDGTTVEVDGPGTADLGKDGTITVTPTDKAKPGDKITVTVKDGNGDTVDTITITVDKPTGETPAENPNWEDTNVPSNGSVDLPNTGGPVTDGTTVEVDGPGTADLGKDGTITVTPTDKAKPGDKITVTVKDGNGDTVDTITITVGEPTGDDNGGNTDGDNGGNTGGDNGGNNGGNTGGDNGGNNGGDNGGSTGGGNGGSLARTGTEAGGLVAAALGMLGAGWALMRRRRNADDA